MMWIKQLISEQKSVDWTVVYFFPPFCLRRFTFSLAPMVSANLYRNTITFTYQLCELLQSYENYQIERAINILNRIHKLFKLEKKRRQTIKLNIKQGVLKGNLRITDLDVECCFNV